MHVTVSPLVLLVALAFLVPWSTAWTRFRGRLMLAEARWIRRRLERELGVRILVYTGTIEAADKNRQPGTAISAGVLLAGVFVLAGGITMISIGNVKAKRNPAQPLPYQPPLDVLCVQPVTPPWLSTWTGPAPEGGSSYSFSETQKAGRDAARERQNRLRKLLIDDFTNELGKLSAGG